MNAVSTAISCARFCLSAIPRNRRGEEFRARLGGSWDAELIEDDAPFEMTSTYAHLADMTLTVSNYPARRVARPRACVQADRLDHLYVQIPFAEVAMEVKTEGRVVAIEPGRPIIMDLARSFDTLQGAGRSVQAFMPRKAIEKLLPKADDVHATLLQGAAAGILVDHLRSLARRLTDLPVEDAPAIARSTMHLVAASLDGTGDSAEVARPAIEEALMRQAMRLVDDRLLDHRLDTAGLASALRISRATLYRLFEPQGGVAKCIKVRRLTRIRDLLSVACPRPSLANVAADYGFSSGAHLSRAYREHFGQCPSEVVPTVRNQDIGGGEKRGVTEGGLAAWLSAQAH
jgi:AraC-like DNA-binding protein